MALVEKLQVSNRRIKIHTDLPIYTKHFNYGLLFSIFIHGLFFSWYMKILETKYIVTIIVSLIIGGAILGYGYLDYRYKKESLESKTRSEEDASYKELMQKINQGQEAKQKQQQLQNCLDDVNNRFKNAYDSAHSKSPNISNESAKIIMDWLYRDREECFKKYPQE